MHPTGWRHGSVAHKAVDKRCASHQPRLASGNLLLDCGPGLAEPASTSSRSRTRDETAAPQRGAADATQRFRLLVAWVSALAATRFTAGDDFGLESNFPAVLATRAEVFSVDFDIGFLLIFAQICLTSRGQANSNEAGTEYRSPRWQSAQTFFLRCMPVKFITLLPKRPFRLGVPSTGTMNNPKALGSHPWAFLFSGALRRISLHGEHSETRFKRIEAVCSRV
jgi:hypothetical protein